MSVQPSSRRPLWLPVLALAALAAAGLAAVGLSGCGGGAAARLERDRAVVARFVELKGADDARAADLLNPAPPVPAEPMSQEEFDRFVLDSMLHSDLHFKRLRPQPAGAPAAGSRPPRFVISTEGVFNSPRLQVRTGTEAKPQQRSLYNPDVVVEVVDGKLRCVAAGVPD